MQFSKKTLKKNIYSFLTKFKQKVNPKIIAYSKKIFTPKKTSNLHSNQQKKKLMANYFN